MAQYSVKRGKHYHKNNNDIFEIMMLADKNGNIINEFGASANITISAGLVDGYEHINKFGYSSNISGGSSYNTIWSQNNVYSYATNPTVVAVAGTSDVGATVEIQGLDADFNQIVETVTVPSSTTAEYIRVFRMKLVEPATGTTNVGDITATFDGAIRAQIDAGAGQTLMALYTIPANKTGYLLKVAFSLDKSTDAKFRILARDNAVNGAFQLKGQFGTFATNVEYNYPVPLKFTEKTDIECRGIAGNTCGAGAIFDLILVDN
jgi:hypothetical protein